MDALHCIHTRRSIREYRSEPIDDDVVRELIGAAMMAPSAGNVRPWQFIVLTDSEVLLEAARVHPHGAMCVDAPVSVLVCGDLSLEKYPGNWIADCSAATQNLLLAAHARGLGSVWTGIYPEQDRIVAFRELLDLPDHVVPLALVPIGHPVHAGGAAERFDEEKVHRNMW